MDKVCNQCGKSYPLDDFPIQHSTHRSTYRNTCKYCRYSYRQHKHYRPKECNRGLACVSPYGASQSIKNYHKNKNSADGHSHTCKYCMAYERSGTLPIRDNQVKCASGSECLSSNNGVLPMGQFYKNRTRPNGLMPYCIKCYKALRTKWSNK